MIDITLLALKNVAASPARSIILALCVAALTSMQVATSIVDRATAVGLEKGLSRLGADIMIVPRTVDKAVIKSYTTGEPATFYMPGDILQKVKRYSFIDKISPQLYIKSLTGASCCSISSVFLIGFDPETDFTVNPWLGTDTKTLGPDDIICGAAIAMPVGSTARFYGQKFRVAGNLESGGMGLDFSIFIPLGTAHRMIMESQRKAEKSLEIKTGDISALLIKLKPEAEGGIPSWKAAFEIEKEIPDISVVRPADLTEKVRKNLSRLVTMSTSISLAVWTLCAVLIALIFAMIARERQRETGLLRALGATRLHIFIMMETEALIITFLGAVFGALSSWGITLLFSQMISLKLEIPLSPLVFGDTASIISKSVGLAVIVGCLSALIPALRSTFLEPYEAIRREK